MFKHRFHLSPFAVGLFAVLVTPNTSIAMPIRATFDHAGFSHDREFFTPDTWDLEFGGKHSYVLARETMDFTPSIFQPGYIRGLKWFEEERPTKAIFYDRLPVRFHYPVIRPRERHNNPVPEPSSLLLLSVGIAGMKVLRRQSRK